MDAKRAKVFTTDPTYIKSLLKVCHDLIERSKHAQEAARVSSQRWCEVRDRNDLYTKKSRI